MDRRHGERGKTDGNVFGAAFVRSGVPDPFCGVGDDGLAGGYVERGGLSFRISVFDAQHTFQHDSEFVELGSLAGFNPSSGAAHMGHTGRRGLGINAANVFVNQFGFVAWGRDACGLRDETGHDFLGRGLSALGSDFGPDRSIRVVRLPLDHGDWIDVTSGRVLSVQGRRGVGLNLSARDTDTASPESRVCRG